MTVITTRGDKSAKKTKTKRGKKAQRDVSDDLQKQRVSSSEAWTSMASALDHFSLRIGSLKKGSI